MINKKNKKIEVFLVSIVLVVMLCNFVSAGVAMSLGYHDKNPLLMAPGETNEIVFGLFQNSEDTDAILTLELADGEEIATLTDKNLDSFIVPGGSRDTRINMEISIPNSAPENYQYRVAVRYTDITPKAEEEGTLMFIRSETIGIPILVQIPERALSKLGIFAIIVLSIILVIVLIIFLFYLLRKKTQSIKK